MRGDMHRLGGLEPSVLAHGARGSVGVARGGFRGHAPKQVGVARFVLIEVKAGVVGAVEKSKQHEQRASGEQSPAGPTPIANAFIGDARLVAQTRVLQKSS